MCRARESEPLRHAPQSREPCHPAPVPLAGEVAKKMQQLEAQRGTERRPVRKHRRPSNDLFLSRCNRQQEVSVRREQRIYREQKHANSSSGFCAALSCLLSGEVPHNGLSTERLPAQLLQHEDACAGKGASYSCAWERASVLQSRGPATDEKGTAALEAAHAGPLQG